MPSTAVRACPAARARARTRGAAAWVAMNERCRENCAFAIAATMELAPDVPAGLFNLVADMKDWELAAIHDNPVIL